MCGDWTWQAGWGIFVSFWESPLRILSFDDREAVGSLRALSFPPSLPSPLARVALRRRLVFSSSLVQADLFQFSVNTNVSSVTSIKYFHNASPKAPDTALVKDLL